MGHHERRCGHFWALRAAVKSLENKAVRGQKLRVAVVGSGAAGAATALFLRRVGHEVVVFEQASECRAVGAGFLLQPTGLAVLRDIGVEKEVLAHASRVERLHVVEADGRELMDLRYGELGENSFGAGLHRDVIMRALLGRMEREKIEIRWDSRVTEVRKRAAGWCVADGNFDLLVVADGARSALRRHLLGDGHDRGYSWGAHWFIGKRDAAFADDELFQTVRGTGKMAGFLPTGRRWGDAGVGGEDLLSLFWSVPLGEDGFTRRRPLAAWKSGILELCPQAEVFLGQIEDWSQVLTARYGDVRLKNWHGERVVFLGDAGHAMSPQLGQGVNLALRDAQCLAACLAENKGVENALALYSKRRHATLTYYQMATRGLTPWFQSDYEWLDPWRRFGFRTAQKIGPLRRMMTKSMAGSALDFSIRAGKSGDHD